MKIPTKVTRQSPLTGVTRVKEIVLDPDDLARYEMGDDLIQRCFPYLSASDREFIMTGITDDEWETLKGDD